MINVRLLPLNANGARDRATIETHLPPSDPDEGPGHLVLGAKRAIGFTQFENDDGWHVWGADDENVWLSDEYDTFEAAAWYAVTAILKAWTHPDFFQQP